MKPVAKGKQAFLDYYKTIFPDPKEFEQFLIALGAKSLPILRFTKKDEQRLRDIWEKQRLPWRTLRWYSSALEWPESMPEKSELPGHKERFTYAMNASSLIPVLALDPKPDDVILDACAAPGGKTLFIADLMEKQGTLVANDLSPLRLGRMRQLLTAYGHHWVQTWKKPAELIGRFAPASFNKILLDAPCSSEKHVYNSDYINDWSINRVKTLQKRQIGLLSSLFLALKPGGRLVYSTCSITPEENEVVVERILEKHGQDVELNPWAVSSPGNGDTTRRILPHQQQGLDPMFVAVFRKIA